MSFNELKQLLWVKTPKGQGTVLAIIDYGRDADLQWVCIIREGKHRRRCWTFENQEIEMVANRTLEGEV